MENIVLFRDSLAEQRELEVCKKYFKVERSRMNICSNQLVIPRYSALPYYQELEYDVSLVGSKLINSYKQHQFVADISNWYPYLEQFTPKTWMTAHEAISDNFDGPFVLKGYTNSRKQLWKTHMFAENKRKIMDVYFNLMDDSMLQHQNICVRQFVELSNYGFDSINGNMPISKEFRCFFYKDKLLCKSFYWSQHTSELKTWGDHREIPDDFLTKVADIVSEHINFWVVDVAQTKKGNWIVIELNDGTMSGLSCNEPDRLYKNLLDCLTFDKKI